MDLNVVLAGDDAFLEKKVANLEPLVTGELNDQSMVGVVNYVATALEGLLEGLRDALKVEVIFKPLYNCDTLSTVTLHDTQVNVVLCVGLVVKLV